MSSQNQTDTVSDKTNQNDLNTSTKANSEQSFAFYGSKLFVKFFAWICATTLITVLLATIYGYFCHFKPMRDEFVSITSEMLHNYGQNLVQTYETDPEARLRLHKGFGRNWLFDSNLNNLLTNYSGSHENKQNSSLWDTNSLHFSTSKDKKSDYVQQRLRFTFNPFEHKFKDFYVKNENKIKAIAQSLLKNDEEQYFKIDKEIFVGCQLTSESDNKYAILAHIPKPVSEQGKEFVFNKAIDLFPFFLLICGLLCFFMARYVVKPVVELREASHKFAKGDFSTHIIESSLSRGDELGDLAADFNDMAEKIELGINSQKRLFNDISHELRSPLARMQVALELLQMKASNSEKPLMDRLEKDINRMNALITEILNFSKLENRETGCSYEDIDLNKMLTSVCNDANFEGKTTNKNVKLIIKQNSHIKGISEILERAIENIIRNGLKYTPENSSVEVILDKCDGKPTIWIADHGPGVPQEEIEKIFAPFYRVNLDRNPQNGGIGLGLSIAQRAIQLHKGSIKMSNRPEGGLIAEIKL